MKAQTYLDETDEWMDIPDRAPTPYEALASEIGRLTDTKSKQYGDSAERAEKIMKVLYPNGVPVEAFRNALLIVRMCDKLCRIATQDTTGVDGGGEDAWRDMAGYSLIGAKRNTVK
jgi:hypothetical protein